MEEAKHLSKQWDWTLVPGFTASKILWLKNNEPENFSKLAKVLLPHDYFNYYLTGRYCMEVKLLTIYPLTFIAYPGCQFAVCTVLHLMLKELSWTTLHLQFLVAHA